MLNNMVPLVHSRTGFWPLWSRYRGSWECAGCTKQLDTVYSTTIDCFDRVVSSEPDERVESERLYYLLRSRSTLHKTKVHVARSANVRGVYVEF